MTHSRWLTIATHFPTLSNSIFHELNLVGPCCVRLWPKLWWRWHCLLVHPLASMNYWSSFILWPMHHNCVGTPYGSFDPIFNSLFSWFSLHIFLDLFFTFFHHLLYYNCDIFYHGKCDIIWHYVLIPLRIIVEF